MTTGVETGGGQSNEGQSSGAHAHFQLFSPQVQGAVRWRLLSGNNRDLGRSVESYPDTASCLVAIKELVVGLEILQSQVRRRGSNQWQWALLLDARAVVIGAHGYDRQVRCDQAVRQFLEHAATGHVGETLIVSGARRWTGVSAARRAPELGPSSRRLDRGLSA